MNRKSACMQGFTSHRSSNKIFLFGLAAGLLLATSPQRLLAEQDAQNSQQPAPAQASDQSQAPAAPAYTQQTPEQLDQLVAPIALYPDSLVAQVLAGSTFPAEVVEADRWLQDNSTLKGDALAQAVDQQSWDPSVKALTAFPSVLANMDKNLSWTSSLGDAYYNQQQDVMDAVQVMRQKAQTSGNLKTTTQQTVQTQGTTIIIQPADPQVVYVPAYNPWVVYGYPVAPWPFWYPTPGIWFGGPDLSWGIGFGIGYYGGFGWGWNNWGTNWNTHVVVYNHNTYYSRSNTFYNRNTYYRGGGSRGVASNVNRGINGDHATGFNDRNAGNEGSHGVRPATHDTHSGDITDHGIVPGKSDNAGNESRDSNIGGRGGVYNRPGATTHPFNNDTQAMRGYGSSQSRNDSGFSRQQSSPSYSRPQNNGYGYSQSESGMRSGAFSGFNNGGEARSYSSRGASSFGGGGFGGGGFRGGGGGGGRRR